MGAFDDSPYAAFADIEHGSQHLWRSTDSVQATNFLNLFFSQFRAAIAFSAGRHTMNNLVIAVFSWSSPNKIPKCAVAFIAIKMATLQAFRTRANEGVENQDMKSHGPSFFTNFAQADYQITSIIRRWINLVPMNESLFGLVSGYYVAPQRAISSDHVTIKAGNDGIFYQGVQSVRGLTA